MPSDDINCFQVGHIPDDRLDEFALAKRRQLEARKTERDKSAVSILDSFDLTATDEARKQEGSTELAKCVNCNGSGFLKGLFGSSECYLCHGLGVDLTDPVRVAKNYHDRLKRAEEIYRKMKREIERLRKYEPSSEQLEREARENFYHKSKFNKND